MRTFSAWVYDNEISLSGCEMVVTTAVNRQTDVALKLGNVRVTVNNPYAAITREAAQTIADDASKSLKASQSVVVYARRWRDNVWLMRESFKKDLDAMDEPYFERKKLEVGIDHNTRSRWDDSARRAKMIAKFCMVIQPIINGRDVELREVVWMPVQGLAGGTHTTHMWIVDGVEYPEWDVISAEGRTPIDVFEAVKMLCTPRSMTRNGGYWQTEPRTIDTKEPIR